MSFRSLLAMAQEGAQRLGEEGVLCLGVPIAPLDPLLALPQLSQRNDFTWIWDGWPGLTLAATGVEQSLELHGPRRFALAQRFIETSLNRLICPHGTGQAVQRPRLVLAFGFFGHTDGDGVPGVTIVLPRWQLGRQGRHYWLLHQRSLGGTVTARSMAEALWEQAQALRQSPPPLLCLPRLVASSDSWHQPFQSSVKQALDLINRGRLCKLVLAAQQDLLLSNPLNPVDLLRSLRRHQPGSCRFLWRPANRQGNSAVVGASPERLLELRSGRLRCDGLAGTAGVGGDGAQQLLRSGKNRHEHELVVNAIVQSLRSQGLNPQRRPCPRLARHGNLVHLHTLIQANAHGHRVLDLAEALHPTPAVAGLPRREALGWLRSLERFPRGYYGAPLGWVDLCRDADLRVAIRCGQLQGQHLKLTAGAGIVMGSSPGREQEEVELKLSVLQRQFAITRDLQPLQR
ncbi:MAG: isochorismate synthase [Synechococcus sp. SB0665_bin_28]|nr:isochorismate synthase [Synechococcus sp. SB0665_bin_28]MYF20037.1 isochorismate synthase [Synechococcus sp. SB0677_bin_5]